MRCDNRIGKALLFFSFILQASFHSIKSVTGMCAARKTVNIFEIDEEYCLQVLQKWK